MTLINKKLVSMIGAAVALLNTVPAGAAVVVEESFNYNSLSDMLNSANGGIGFDGSAWSISNASGATGLITDGLSMTGVASSGNAFTRNGISQNSNIARRLSSQSEAMLRSGSNMWFSALVNFTDYDGGRAGFIFGSEGFENNSYPDCGPDGNGFGFRFGNMTNKDNTDNIYAFGAQAGTELTSTGFYNTGGAAGTYLVVGQIAYQGDGSNDVLSLWVFAEGDTISTNISSSITLSLDLDETQLNTVSWSDNVEYGVDEIRLGTDFSSVIYPLPAAHWMEGQFGVSWSINGRNTSAVNNWDVAATVAQVKSIPGVKYVIYNLSQGAFGDGFLAPHSVLTALNPGATPQNDRDLFGELAQAFHDEGIKVIAYMACQGPALLKHGASVAYDKVKVDGVWTSVAMDNWSNYVHSVYGSTSRATYKQAYGEIIFEEFAARYGTLVDGWWLDNGLQNFDAQLLYNIAKKHNPDAVVASNGNTSYMDYRSGHPTPVTTAVASDIVNKYKLLLPIESKPDGYHNPDTLGHMYMPLGELWNSGAIVWTVEQGADWQERCMNAGAAWTWSVDISHSSYTFPASRLTRIQDIVAEMALPNEPPVFALDTIYGGEADAGIAYTGSLVGTATDPDGNSLTFDLIPGGYWLEESDGDEEPVYVESSADWLEVAPDGTLSGTPTDAHVGMNHFTIIVEDGKGEIDFAELEILVHNETGRKAVPLRFDDLRGNLSRGMIDGLDDSSSNVTITKAVDGNDTVFSLSIKKRNFDGGANDDTLSWDIRFKAFDVGTYALNGNDSSVTLGSNVMTHTDENEFGVINRYLSAGQSVQFSVENVVINASANTTVQFDGFDGIWGTAGNWIIGVGTGLQSKTLNSNTNWSPPSPTELTLTATANSERVYALDGVFTVFPNNTPYFMASSVQSAAYENTAYTNSLENLDALATELDPGDTLTYSKESGPDWLAVAADGTLSGTPGGDDLGKNIFRIKVEDAEAASDTVVLKIAVNPEDGLLARWSMDDGVGTVVSDVSGHGFDGTVTNGLWVSGLDGSALDFNGTNSSVELPPEAFALIDKEVTVAMWVYGDANLPQHDTLFYASDITGSKVLNIHLPAGNSSVNWDAGTSAERISKAAVAEEYKGKWNHWAFSKNATTGDMKIYHNGSLWHSESGKTNSMATIASATLGSKNSETRFYGGTVDDLRIYNIELSSNQLAQIYAEAVESSYTGWAADLGLGGTNALVTADLDGDGLNNLFEYALGGEPVSRDDRALLPDFGIRFGGSSAEFEYVYRRRRDAASRGLKYVLQTTDDLISGSWTDRSEVELPDPGMIDDDFESVTNHVDMSGVSNGFIRLDIELL